MKRVGVLLRKWKGKNNAKLLGIKEDMFRYLNQYTNLSFLYIPLDYRLKNVKEEWRNIEKTIASLDGLIMTGGSKEHAIDLKITDYCYKHDIPVLGLCLGMQVMGLYLGGKMITLNTNNHYSNDKYVHQITIKKESKLYEIIGKECIIVNSRHHDAITNLDCFASSYSEDNILESLENKNKKFFIGVQWHPESIENDPYTQKLFSAFFESL